MLHYYMNLEHDGYSDTEPRPALCPTCGGDPVWDGCPTCGRVPMYPLRYRPKARRVPRCPVCGRECVTVYYTKENKAFACDKCRKLLTLNAGFACPICGEQCNFFFLTRQGKICACAFCFDNFDAYDAPECFQTSAALDAQSERKETPSC